MPLILDPLKLGLLCSDSSLVVPSSGRAGLDTREPRASAHEHSVQFYKDEAHLCEVVAAFIEEGVRAGESLVVIATEPHRRAFARRLESDGFRVERLSRSGQLRLLDAHEVLATFMRDGEPDPARFQAEVGEVISRVVSSAAGRVRAYGEMVDVLWAEGQRSAALRLEELWTDLQRREPFRLLCAYSMASLYKVPGAIQYVCAAHTHVLAGSGVADEGASVTEQQSFEHYRAAAAAGAERLLGITSALADAVTPDEVLEAIVDQVCAAVDASSAALWLVDDSGRTARLARAAGYSDSAVKALEALPLDLCPSLPALDSIRRGEPVWITSQDALLREYPHLEGLATAGRSYRVSCLPLVSNGHTLGALGLTTTAAARESLEEERGFLLLVARYASQALERLRLLEAERKSRAEADAAATRMSVLSHASRVFADANLDLPERLEEIVRELGTILRSSVGISLLQGDGLLHTAALYHPVAEAQRILRSLARAAPLQVGEGITGTVVRTGESALIPAMDPGEIAARAAPAFRSFLEQFPSYAMICAPLRARGRLLGTVTATRTRAGETYTLADLEMLEGLAERAASAIENSRLLQENVQARGRAEQLYRFAHAAVSADTIDAVFEAALNAIEAAFGTRRTAILLFDEDDVMRFRASRELSDEYRRAVEGHSPWPRDATAPQPVLVPDVERDATFATYRPLFRSERIGSLAFIPLVTRGRLLGKLMVYYGEPHSYSTSEIELASAIGNHLASVTSRFAAVGELERTIHYNELFAGVLAHDLRNPLGAIMTAAQLVLMRQEGEGAKTSKPLGRIIASGQRMSRMIEQLLDVTRARTGGGIEVQRREVNLAELCGQAVGELELVYPERKIWCDFAGDHQGVWDPDRLLQIISNLVANAAQHASADSGIAVRLDGRRTESVILEIHNQGAVPQALLPHLFDPFRGTRTRRDRAQGGLGLGLFIVKELVRAHGGTVEVASSEAQGTTFTVRLPRQPPRA